MVNHKLESSQRCSEVPETDTDDRRRAGVCPLGSAWSSPPRRNIVRNTYYKIGDQYILQNLKEDFI